MSWLTPRGSMKPADAHKGMRVRIHYFLQPSITGTIVSSPSGELNDNFADVAVDGYEGKLVIPALIAEMDALTPEEDPSNARTD